MNAANLSNKRFACEHALKIKFKEHVHEAIKVHHFNVYI